jgi:hypothetical protein
MVFYIYTYIKIGNRKAKQVLSGGWYQWKWGILGKVVGG